MRSYPAYLWLIDTQHQIPRAGFIPYGIPNPETVGQHAEHMADLAQYYAPRSLRRSDVERTVEMAPWHDIAENFTMDIPLNSGVLKKQKYMLERSALRAIREICYRGPEIYSFWFEYECARTAGSRFCHALDKFQLILKLLDYERKDLSPYSFNSWWACAKKYLEKTPFLPDVLRLEALRPAGALRKPVLKTKPISAKEFAALRNDAFRRIDDFRVRFG